jgi:hypothetical protein
MWDYIFNSVIYLEIIIVGTDVELGSADITAGRL